MIAILIPTLCVLIGYLVVAVPIYYYSRRKQVIEKARDIIVKELYVAMNEQSAGRRLDYSFLWRE